MRCSHCVRSSMRWGASGAASATAEHARAGSTTPATALKEQFAQPFRVLAIGLRAPLGTPQRPRLHRLGQMRHRAGPNERVTDEQPARARLDRHVDLLARKARHPTPHGRRRRVDPPPADLARFGVEASNVICLRCTSNPATIAIGASSRAPALPPCASLSRRAEEALVHAIFACRRTRCLSVLLSWRRRGTRPRLLSARSARGRRLHSGSRARRAGESFPAPAPDRPRPDAARRR